ncbi:phospholipase D family nuclease [Noviherbaspirillum soli]|uniref:phospholipase D family nuclease n=1 Tax=Noviherbaspirillum soli TaxID=1064518 RepID=UPI00188AE9AA|nr:phospholipase D family protein [Noviherbaspirillum soli]
MKTIQFSLLAALVAASISHANDFSLKRADEVLRSFAGSRPVAAPAGQQIEVGFSPNQGAEEVVLKVINSSTKSLRVAAYSFTSAPVVSALLAAHKRGVEVAAIVDYRNNFVEGCGDRGACKGKHAVATLANAGIPVRVIDKYAIFHHKFVLSDGKHMELGSFNYSASAATRNAENAMAIWNNPEVVATYAAKWNAYWSEARQPPLDY